MLLTDPLCHTATIRVAAPGPRVFAYLADGKRLGDWSFGCWQTEAREDGVFAGTSLMSGMPAYVRVVADAARLQIDYAVGGTPDALVPRIIARVMPGPAMGEAESVCFLSLIAWRAGNVTDERWRMICASHEIEVFRIRHLIESGG